MKYLSIVLIISVQLLFFSCGKDADLDSLPSLTDIQLIEAIEGDLRLEAMDVVSLPATITATIEAVYIDHFINFARRSARHGYKLGLRSNDHEEMGQLSFAYFNKAGRQLKRDGRDEDSAGTDAPEESGDQEEKECFSFIYPISFTMPDGSTIGGDDHRAVSKQLRAWYEAHPDSNQRPMIQFPVEVAIRDQRYTATNYNELKRLKSACQGALGDVDSGDDRDDGHDGHTSQGDLAYEDRCFTLVYPVSFIMPDGSTITADDVATLKTAFSEWYSTNPNAEAIPMLIYPVDIIFKEETYNINSEEALRRFEVACDRDGEELDNNRDILFEWTSCIELVFPVSFIMPDGSIISAEDADALKAAIEEWYKSHPDVQTRPSIQYPINVVVKEEAHTINSNEELRRLEASCDQDNKNFDCPDAKADIGDKCLDKDRREGQINSDCICEIG